MGDLFYFLLSNRQATFVNMVIGVLLFISLLFLFFCKSSRDERGRKIIGKASIVSLICFGICATLFSQYSNTFLSNYHPMEKLLYWTHF